MNVAYEQLIRMMVLVIVFLIIAAAVAVATIVYFTITYMTIKCDSCKKRRLRVGSEIVTTDTGITIGHLCRDCVQKLHANTL